MSETFVPLCIGLVIQKRGLFMKYDRRCYISMVCKCWVALKIYALDIFFEMVINHRIRCINQCFGVSFKTDIGYNNFDYVIFKVYCMKLNIPKVNIPKLNVNAFNLRKGVNNRYQRGKVYRPLHKSRITYDNALELARDVHMDKDIRYNCLVSGNFIFGDFIEAFIVHNNVKCKNLTISTLSMDQNNVDSLENLISGNFVDELNLIVSDYFFVHEQKAIIPYIYKHLDIDNKFQLAVAGIHTKIAMFETLSSKKIVIHGSANLRSSSNIEQFVIEENQDLFDFWYECHLGILQEYKTINKDKLINHSLRGSSAWDSINNQ